jgi:hypothetical protein
VVSSDAISGGWVVSDNWFGNKPKQYSLGPFSEMMKGFAHFGMLSLHWTYGNLHGVVHHVLAGNPRLTAAWKKKVQADTKAFKKKSGEELTSHETWIIQQILKASAPRKAQPKRKVAK